MKEIIINTFLRSEMIDITSKIQDYITDEVLENCIITIYVPHTTAGVTINENADPDVCHDILKTLDKLIPERDNYQHSEGNSDAHLKATLIGSSVNVILKDKKLALGRWQGIFFCEFDGPRSRKVFISSS